MYSAYAQFFSCFCFVPVILDQDFYDFVHKIRSPFCLSATWLDLLEINIIFVDDIVF